MTLMIAIKMTIIIKILNILNAIKAINITTIRKITKNIIKNNNKSIFNCNDTINGKTYYNNNKKSTDKCYLISNISIDSKQSNKNDKTTCKRRNKGNVFMKMIMIINNKI